MGLPDRGDLVRDSILLAVDRLTQETGEAPTVREVAAAIPGGRSASNTHRHIGVLVDRGMLARSPDPRSLALTEAGRAYVQHLRGQRP